ncbi:hypothetical protein [common midwife toad virus -E]|uniref:Uncharacterized protein n=1 Tax=Common midwife toad virus TaxID=540070 RepID=H6WEE1_9VIRU|nr:hypothetical protein [common midwife toad virus -E]
MTLRGLYIYIRRPSSVNIFVCERSMRETKNVDNLSDYYLERIYLLIVISSDRTILSVIILREHILRDIFCKRV